jgi:hypothetical protein
MPLQDIAAFLYFLGEAGLLVWCNLSGHGASAKEAYWGKCRSHQKAIWNITKDIASMDRLFSEYFSQ